jgi:4-hydroxy-4-methyl-2-oxoglutarate aldolase
MPEIAPPISKTTSPVMSQARHSQEELDAIRRYTAPTIANALELFGIAPTSGYCSSAMKCHYPHMPLMVGYAVTARVSTDRPPSKVRPSVHEPDYWRFVSSQPGPKVAVVQDIDVPSLGSMWGEWNSNVHKALGCVGMVTEGGARDIDAVHKLGFHYFSTHVIVSHGYGAFIDYGGSVRVAGLVVNTGDLLVGDMHGVLMIPAEIPLFELAKAAGEIDRLESEIFAFCQSPNFNIDDLAKLDLSVQKRWPKPLGSDVRTTITA